MRLPDLVAYQAAVQHPSTAFADPQLRAATVTTGSLGLPRAVAGNFAVTYQLRAGGQQWAVRCFHREAADRAPRYAAISQCLSRLRNGPLVPIEYLDAGVRVGQAWYPITKMAWLDGRPLNRAVEDCLSKPSALADIERRFVAVIHELRRLGIAHGDLQHGNILVDGAGTLRLVDYDGMFVAALRGRAASETGDPNYQHPRRTNQFDAELDRFAAIVIVVALRALAVVPRLWQTYNTGDNLLFRRADFANPTASPLFRDLAALAAMREVSQRLARICQEPYSRVPTLDEFLYVPPPALSSRHVAVLNTLYAPTRKPHSWKLRRAVVQTSVAVSRDGVTLASGDHDGRITLRDLATGRTRRSMRLPRNAGSVRALAFSHSGALMAVTADGPNLSVWNVVEQRRPLELRVSGRAVRSVALSSNGAWLVASGDDGTLQCWKVASGRLTASFSMPASLTTLGVTNDGHFIAGAGPRVPLTVWSVRDGQLATHLPVGRGVTCLAFTADGARLAVGTLGGRLSVWQLRPVQPTHELPATSSAFEAVGFPPDGLAVATSARDGSVWLRRLAPSTSGRGRGVRATYERQPAAKRPSAPPVQPLSATRVISSSYRLFDWLRRVALL